RTRHSLGDERFEKLMIFLLSLLITLQWDAVPDALTYRVYRASSPVLMLALWLYDYAEVTETELKEDVGPDVYHYRAVTCVNSLGLESLPSNGIWIYCRD